MTSGAGTSELRAALAAAMNDVERRSAEGGWPEPVPATHHADCIHVGSIAGLLASPATAPSEGGLAALLQRHAAVRERPSQAAYEALIDDLLAALARPAPLDDRLATITPDEDGEFRVALPPGRTLRVHAVVAPLDDLDVERLARAICATREPVVDVIDDVFVDDECRARANQIAAAYTATESQP